MTLLDRARDFAAKAHAGQKRKYTDAEYITHPEAVVAILRSAGIEDETTLAAAFLHDVVEDTTVTQLEILAEFGPTVCAIVSSLTNVGHEFGNRATRTRIDRERIALSSPRAQSIKVADLIDNTSSIVERDPKFAVTYMREKALLLPLLTKADEGLRKRAAEMLAAYEEGQVADWLEGRPHCNGNGG